MSVTVALTREMLRPLANTLASKVILSYLGSDGERREIRVGKSDALDALESDETLTFSFRETSGVIRNRKDENGNPFQEEEARMTLVITA